MAIAWKMYRSHNPSYPRFLRTSAKRDANPGSVAVRANAEGEKELTQVQSQMRHFPLENGNTVMPSGRLSSLRSWPTGSKLHWSQQMTRHVWWCHSKRSVVVNDQRWSGRREDVGHICLLWLHNSIYVGHRWGGPGIDWLQFKLIHCPAKCLLQWTEDNSSMLQNWVVLPKKDMPVGAGQAGVSKQQSEKMILCHPTDVGDLGFQEVMGWLMTTHQSMIPGHVGCCQIV